MVLTLWSVRSRHTQASDNDVNKIYNGINNFFTLKIHHGGIFTKSLGRRYIDGTVDYVDFVDIDVFSVHKLDTMVQEIGYVEGHTLYYHFLIPEIELDFGLLLLGNDGDVHILSMYVEKNNQVVIEELDNDLSPELDRNQKKGKDGGSCSRKLDYSQSIVSYGQFGGPSRLINIRCSKRNEISSNMNEIEHPDIDEEPLIHDEVVMSENDNDEQVMEDEAIMSSEFDGEDDAIKTVFDEEPLIDDVEVNIINFCSVVDEDIDLGQSDQTNINKEAHEDIEDEPLEVLDNDVFESVASEQEPRKKLLKSILKPVACSSGEVHTKAFKVGQSFKENEKVRELIASYSVKERRDLHYVKNDKTRLRVKCRGVVLELTGGTNKGKGNLVLSKERTCPWVLLVSRSNEKEVWTVKTYEDSHTCLQTRTVRACSSHFLANNILHQVESNPTIPARALQEELVQRYSLAISKMKVLRAKAIAKKYVFGDYEKQYGLLRDYGMELPSKNPGTTVKIEFQPEATLCSETRIFKRIYVCLGPLKEGFKKGLRDFLGFDGAFLKGPFPGQILSAVGLDSNNGIYPVAYAIVEAENLNSWTWFLELLGNDLDLHPSSNFTFITDRKKGILPDIAKLFLVAEHRFCLRHVFENMKLQHKGDELREAVWKCGKATSILRFDRAMEDLKKLNPQAHEWLTKIHAIHWARSHFSGRAITDSLTNNLCEVFNSKLDEARYKPIITCLEFIREYLTNRIVNVHKVLGKCKGSLTPTATTILEKNKTEANQLRVLFAGSDKYQVTGQWMEQYVVNLKERSCTCRNWDITGIPCKHAIAAMYDKLQNGSKCGDPEDWVNKCYWLSTWIAMYQHTIHPINGRSMWPRSDCPTTLVPPKHHKQVGSPKKKRKTATDEPSQRTNLSRKYLTVTCSKCHNKGHNARTCKGQGCPIEVGKGE